MCELHHYTLQRIPEALHISQFKKKLSGTDFCRNVLKVILQWFETCVRCQRQVVQCDRIKISSENMWQEVRFCEDASNPNTADLCGQVCYGLLQLGESGRRTGSSAALPALDKLAQGFGVF